MATALIVIFWDISLGLACFLGAGAVLLRSKADLGGGGDVDQPLWNMIGSAFIVTWPNPQALIDSILMLEPF